MKGVKRMRLGLIAAAATGAAIIAGLMLAGQAFGATNSLSVGDAEGQPGDTVTVDVTANVPGGLGAWTMDISYDPDQVTATDCDGGDANSVCNTDYGSTGDTVRITGASANGEEGETLLGTIDFKINGDLSCADVDSSLDLSVEVFADATVGSPQDISGDTDLSNGSITCTEAQPTERPTALPPTGTGGLSDSDGGMGFGWVIMALAAAGLAGMAGYGALRVRSTRA